MLATGADSIAAEAAIEEGIGIIGLLPFDLDLYLEDFKLSEDRERFQRLYSSCLEIHTLPCLPGSTRTEIEAGGDSRDRQYAYGGSFIVRYSNSLIAVWDGTDSGLIGGTADIVRTQLCANPSGYLRQADFLGGRQTGPVNWIYSRRSGLPEAPECAPASLPIDCVRMCPGFNSTHEMLYPAGWKYVPPEEKKITKGKDAQRYYEGVFSSIDGLNRDVLKIGKTRQSDDMDFTEKGIGDLHSLADYLALRFRKRSHGAIFAMVVIGVITFSQMVIFDELLNNAFVLFSFFLSLLASIVLFSFIRRSAFDSKYFDYRSLAELLRVFGALGKIGIVVDPTELITTKQQSLLGWVVDTVRSITLPSSFIHKERTKECFKVMMAEWVDDQALYYSTSISKRQKGLIPKRRLRLALFTGALLSALGFLVVKALASASGLDTSPWWDLGWIKQGSGPYSNVTSWLQAAFDILLSAGAALALYIDMLDLEDEIHLFERGSMIFRRASIFMHEALKRGDLDLFNSLAVELAREAVGENFEWNDNHRRTPLEMPLG